MRTPAGVSHAGTEIELWESERFVVFHRADNVGFKAGNLKALEATCWAGFRLHVPARCGLATAEGCPATLSGGHRCRTGDGVRADQTPLPLRSPGPLQTLFAINEEACYLVDLPGRQRLRQMILFTGCCTLFDIRKLAAVGGFRAGHLTEDIDLSNRLYLAGYSGVYLEDVSNVGEVPPNYRAFRRQQERWAIGSARTFKEYFVPVLRSDLPWPIKLSLLRQNAYFTVALGVEISLLWSMLAVAGDPGSPLRTVGLVIVPVLLFALFSNVLPLLVGVAKKTRVGQPALHPGSVLDRPVGGAHVRDRQHQGLPQRGADLVRDPEDEPAQGCGRGARCPPDARTEPVDPAAADRHVRKCVRQQPRRVGSPGPGGHLRRAVDAVDDHCHGVELTSHRPGGARGRLGAGLTSRDHLLRRPPAVARGGAGDRAAPARPGRAVRAVGVTARVTRNPTFIPSPARSGTS